MRAKKIPTWFIHTKLVSDYYALNILNSYIHFHKIGCIRIWSKAYFGAKNIGRLLFILSCLYYLMNWAPSFLIYYVNQVEIGTPPSKTGYLWNPSELPDLRGHGLGQLHTTTPPVDKTEKLWVGLKMFERTVCWGKFKWYVKFRPKDYLP